jgi:hypothetical protein
MHPKLIEWQQFLRPPEIGTVHTKYFNIGTGAGLRYEWLLDIAGTAIYVIGNEQ